jgi:hypothetical protein
LTVRVRRIVALWRNPNSFIFKILKVKRPNTKFKPSSGTTETNHLYIRIIETPSFSHETIPFKHDRVGGGGALQIYNTLLARPAYLTKANKDNASYFKGLSNFLKLVSNWYLQGQSLISVAIFASHQSMILSIYIEMYPNPSTENMGVLLRLVIDFSA